MSHVNLVVPPWGTGYSFFACFLAIPLPVKHQLVPDTFLIGQLQALPVTTERLQVVTRQDPILSRVLQFVREGWPGDVDQKTELKPYESRKEELSTEGDCLLWGNGVVIPHKLC